MKFTQGHTAGLKPGLTSGAPGRLLAVVLSWGGGDTDGRALQNCGGFRGL